MSNSLKVAATLIASEDVTFTSQYSLINKTKTKVAMAVIVDSIMIASLDSLLLSLELANLFQTDGISNPRATGKTQRAVTGWVYRQTVRGDMVRCIGG